MFEVWVCLKFGFIRSLGLFEVWVCSEFGFVRSSGLFEAWVYSKFGFIRSLGLFEVCVYSTLTILRSSIIIFYYILIPRQDKNQYQNRRSDAFVNPFVKVSFTAKTSDRSKEKHFCQNFSIFCTRLCIFS